MKALLKLGQNGFGQKRSPSSLGKEDMVVISMNYIFYDHVMKKKCLNELYRLTSCKNFLKESLGTVMNH